MFNEHVHTVAVTASVSPWPARIATALFALSAGFSGASMVLWREPIPEVFARLELPFALAALLGAWKILGALALFVPGVPRLKEWIYAGFAFELSGAVALHLAAGDTLTQSGGPILLFVMGAASYVLRRREEDALDVPSAAVDPEPAA